MKRIYWSILLILFLRSALIAAPGISNCTTGIGGAGTGTTASSSSVNLPAPPSAGTIGIFIGAAYRNGGPTFNAPTDNQSNTYLIDIQHNDTYDGRQLAGIGSGKINTTGSPFTMTMNLAASSDFIWQGCEVTGLDTTTWRDKTGSNQWVLSSSDVITADAPNGQSGDLVISCVALLISSSDAHIQTPAGYTLLFADQSNNYINSACAYKIESGTGPSAATWVHDSSIASTAVISTYKPAGGGGGGTSASTLTLMGVGH